MEAWIAHVTALGVALGAPGTAAAAELDAMKPCYVAAGPAASDREPMMIGGTGFTPDARLDIALDGRVVAPSVPVELDGTLAPETLPAPLQAEGQRRFAVTATEQGTGLVATAFTRVTALELALRPARARPSSRVTFSGRGFTDRRPVYAHYLYRGRVRKTVRLARAHGACGRFEVRRRQMPIARPRVGTWTLQADQRRRYTWPPDASAYRIRIEVRRAGDARAVRVAAH